MSYPPGMTLRPIDDWPWPETEKRRTSPFHSTFSATQAELGRELRMLDEHGRRYPPSVLQIGLRPQDFRNDGLPRADARTPAHPGVILTVSPDNKPVLSFHCDTFTHWHDNLRAITLTLESLRRVERYGAIDSGQQYRGFQELPAAPTVDEKQAAARFIIGAAYPNTVFGADVVQRHIRDLYAGNADGRAMVRTAKANTHPDRQDGHRALWMEVAGAIEILASSGVDWINR
ncbi:molecular chaperone DnaJ [Mycolicibacterium sphagni]|uniref:molecular chaperone DnaJ n=1 Tax=Mycolicibacterium sphagni TaxID=1786 RepID=UPI0021F263EB|nr:molecular chaperone DnaJ [Mycolicibacterium sphagni]MCV7175090.1 molecular chaperone DnaJ [Mycolicibacterium sphagni]